MNLQEILIPTGVARAGMTFGDALKECVKRDVPGIPFVDEQGHIIGRFSVRHAFRLTCVPKDVIRGAHLLGDNLSHMTMPELNAEEVMARPIEEFILEDAIRLAPGSPAIKALAIMEQYNTSYLFVTEGESYLGVITRMDIAGLVASMRL